MQKLHTPTPAMITRTKYDSLDESRLMEWLVSVDTAKPEESDVSVGC